MNKFQKLLDFLSEIVNQPSLINLILDRNDAWKRKFEATYGHSHYLKQVQLSEISDSNTFEIPNVSFLGGGSMPTDLALLRILCQQVTNCKYFEIGTWRGESANNVADVTSVCYTLNLSNEELMALGLHEDYAKAQAVLSKDNPRITHLVGDSKEFDFAGLNKKFDVIFIDGNHHYDYVKSDTEKVFKHLVHENSVVVWHDYAYSPEDVRYEVYKAILDGTDKKIHQNIYHVANSMCAIYTKQDLKKSTLKIPVLPDKNFEVRFTKTDLK